MNRKKIITLSIVSILIISTIAILYNTYYKSKVYENNKAEKNINNNMISIYLEKSYDSGQYELSTSSKWPTGYLFNKSLSYCEGGSSLSWNDSDNSVSVNTRITDKCYVYFDKYLSANLNSVSTEDTLTNSFTMVISATPGKNEIVKYLYSLDDGQTYIETTNNIVSVTGLTKNTLYRLKVYAVDSEGIKSNILSTSVQTPDKVVFADFIKSKYTGTQGQNSLYYHDNTLTNGAGDNSYRYSGADFVLTDKAKNAGYKSVIASSSTEKTEIIYFSCGSSQSFVGALCDATDNTPRYRLRYDSAGTVYSTFGAALDKAVADGYITKDNVKNFVCFGSTADTCPEMNLYRIIGVFGDQIKLIKYDYSNRTDIGTGGEYYGLSTSFRSGSRNNPERHYSYYWNYKTNKKASSDWSTSLLNTTNLNTNLINYLTSAWTNKIASTTWKVSAQTDWRVVTKNMYTNEITNASKEYFLDGKSKIGLMYTSDYGYAADPSAWSTTLDKYYTTAVKSNNWMWMGHEEWTLTPYSSTTSNSSAFIIQMEGDLSNSVTSTEACVRPSFYLNADVTLADGLGTIDKPYRIEI